MLLEKMSVTMLNYRHMGIFAKRSTDKQPPGTSFRNITVLLLAALFACTLSGFAGAASLYDTGQTKCYMTAEPWSQIPCYGTGQDGEYSSAPLSYSAVNSTVTDNNTGLVWQQQNDGTLRTFSQAIKPGTIGHR